MFSNSKDTNMQGSGFKPHISHLFPLKVGHLTRFGRTIFTIRLYLNKRVNNHLGPWI